MEKIFNSWGKKKKTHTVPMFVLENVGEGDVAELADEGDIPLCLHAD